VELILVESIEACNGLRIIAMLWESTREANYLFGLCPPMSGRAVPFRPMPKNGEATPPPGGVAA